MNDLVRHGALITFDLLSVFLFSGIVFGWAPLNSMLLQEGTFYAAKCELVDGVRQVPCDAQRAALNQAFTIASTAVSLVALPAGYFIDKKGPIWGVSVAGVLEVLGLIGIALCEDVGSSSFDLFLYSFTLISIGGAMTMFCGYTLPFVFPVYATLLVETTSCLFDGSCIIFLGFNVVYSAGMSFPFLWWSYAVLAVIIYSCLLASWVMCSEELKASREPVEEDPDVSAQAAADTAVRPVVESIDKRPLTQQLKTLEFFAIFLYGTIQVTRSNLYLGTVDLYNETLEGKVSMSSGELTTLAGLIIPFGFVAVPIIEASVHHLGLVGTVHLTTIIGMCYAAVQILFTNAIMQLVGAGLFAVWRAYLFSIISAFVMSTFGAQTMGRIMGVCFLSAAIVNLAQAPLVSWTLSSQNGDFKPLLLGAMLICLPLPVPWFVVQWKQRLNSARSPLLSSDSNAQISHSEGSFPPPPTSWHGTALGTSRPIEVLQTMHRRSSVSEMNRQASERRASQQLAQVNA